MAKNMDSESIFLIHKIVKYHQLPVSQLQVGEMNDEKIVLPPIQEKTAEKDVGSSHERNSSSQS
jgi:hypothetical protein